MSVFPTGCHETHSGRIRGRNCLCRAGEIIKLFVIKCLEECSVRQYPFIFG